MRYPGVVDDNVAAWAMGLLTGLPPEPNSRNTSPATTATATAAAMNCACGSARLRGGSAGGCATGAAPGVCPGDGTCPGGGTDVPTRARSAAPASDLRDASLFSAHVGDPETIAAMRSVREVRAATRAESIMVDSEPLLERSEQLAALQSELDAITASGRGRLVLIAGEAGIGKSALIDAFCRGLDVAVLRGACEALFTPRPLGPLVDISDQLGGTFAALVDAGVTPSDLLAALAGELRRGAATVVVLEDLHWADDATLDVVRLLGRRCDAFPALVLATYRDDELERTHPLRITLGELPRSNVTRLRLAPLSAQAIASLAGPDGLDPVALHQRTAGNPFYVSEVLAAGGTAMPDSVRDAVLARAARLSDRGRALLDAVAIVPQRAELWLLEALAADDLSELESCIDAGMLRATDDAVAFRHEIARGAVAAVLPPDRALALH